MPPTLLLRCADLAQTRRFYAETLGFSVFDSVAGTLTVGRRDARLIFTAQALWPGPLGCSGTIYFEEIDLDGYFATLERAVAVAWPPQAMPYGGREFGITDCNGYFLAFRQTR